MTGFGLSLTQLANCESEINGSLAKALSQMGLCVDRLSSLYTEQASKENEAFEEPMRDYIRMLAQCKQVRGRGRARGVGLGLGLGLGLVNLSDTKPKPASIFPRPDGPRLLPLPLISPRPSRRATPP